MWLLGKEYNGDKQEYMHAERNNVLLINNQLYIHKTLGVNYTSYDLRRQKDVINSMSHPNVMVLSHEDGEDKHPFWYTHVVKIFHIHVLHYRSESLPKAEQTPMEHQHMDVLWVHWFGLDTDAWGGWSKKHLHGVQYLSFPWTILGPLVSLTQCRSFGESTSSPTFPGAGQTQDSLHQ